MFGWLLLAPLSLFLNPQLAAQATDQAALIDLSTEVWLRQVRPLAVGTMIVAAFYTLFKLRTSLVQGISRAFADLQAAKTAGGQIKRLSIDLDFRKTGIAIGVLSLPLLGLYWYFSQNLPGLCS